jgi:hypothetical protein
VTTPFDVRIDTSNNFFLLTRAGGADPCGLPQVLMAWGAHGDGFSGLNWSVLRMSKVAQMS